MIRRALFAATVLFLSSCESSGNRASGPVDPQIRDAIAKIKAIDNHAHPVRPTLASDKPDDGYDALPVETLEPQSDPELQRTATPQVVDAHKQMSALENDRAKLGLDYANHVLDALNTETMLANRVFVGPGLQAPRFLWVPFADALMYPLPTDSLIDNPDRKAFFADEDRLLKRYYADLGIAARPATLDQYLDKVVRATLEKQKSAGAVAEKFEMAYLRTLAVGNPAKADAEKYYATGKGDYKALQDYIFRFIAAECGRLGMAVHIHAAAGGGGYFDVSGANPMLLEPLFNDPSLRKTNFVMLHGGWPFGRELTALLTKPNVYTDFSEQTAMNYPRDTSEEIRAWLEYVPEKVLYATDAYPAAPPEYGWEEAGYIASQNGREALGLALTGMVQDHEITRDRAGELARMVLRDNARKLYGLK